LDDEWGFSLVHQKSDYEDQVKDEINNKSKTNLIFSAWLFWSFVPNKISWNIRSERLILGIKENSNA
jgi:hypothetical protein